MTILDTLVGQAKSAISRAYLAAGLLPAAVAIDGWRLYRNGFASIRDEMSSLTLTFNKLPGDLLFNLMLIASVGILFYTGRMMVLRALQTVPGGVLSLLRRHLLAVQADRWWANRRERGRLEDRSTPVELAADKKFEDQNADAAMTAADRRAALEKSLAARHHARGGARH
jgi:hypothetical protein